MSIAFSALLILFLALPGILLCIAFRATSGRPVWFRPIADEVPIGIVISAVMHAVWIALFNFFGASFGLRVDLHAAIVLLSGVDVEQLPLAAQALSDHFGWVSLYMFSICLMGMVLGRLLSWLVRRHRLDEHFPILQSNDWYYLLRGESAHEWYEEHEYPDSVVIGALVGEHLYRGILADYVISQTGELEAIVLEAVSRRRITDDDPAMQQGLSDLGPDDPLPYYSISAHFVVLKYSEITNLAISGIWLVDEAMKVEDEAV